MRNTILVQNPHLNGCAIAVAYELICKTISSKMHCRWIREWYLVLEFNCFDLIYLFWFDFDKIPKSAVNYMNENLTTNSVWSTNVPFMKSNIRKLVAVAAPHMTLHIRISQLFMNKHHITNGCTDANVDCVWFVNSEIHLRFPQVLSHDQNGI